jgi:hypothetical protein
MTATTGGIKAAMNIKAPQIDVQIVRIKEMPPFPDNALAALLSHP